MAWTVLKGSGKADPNAEEGWTLLPDGSILTIDTENGANSERYLPATDTWISAGITPVPLSVGEEIGPQVLRPDGTVFVVGATGHTAVYNSSQQTWSAGPDLPSSNGSQLEEWDGPGTLLPDGNVLFAATSANTRFLFEFDGTKLNPVPNATPCYVMISLPTGQVLCDGSQLYTPSGNPNPAWAPSISRAPTTVQPGQTYLAIGNQFNGLSQANMVGDDYQGATNYPLVRIVNTATGHVFYCKTHGHSTMGVATGTTPTSTEFDVPSTIDAGPSTLFVVANGIPSKGWSITVATVSAAPAIANVEGSGLSNPAVKAISANGFFTIFGTNFAPIGTSRSLTQSDIVNGVLPTNLASTCVYVGPVPAYITYVSPSQINAIVPALASTAPVVVTYTKAGVTVISGCGTASQNSSPLFEAQYASASPEFLYWTQNANGQNPVIAVDALHGDYIGVTGSVPGLTLRTAKAGDLLTLYGIGFGATSSGPTPGAIPAGADSATAGYTLMVGQTPVPASYVGVTPTVAGLYQVNFIVPPNLGPGNQPIVLNVNGVSTPPGAFVAIGQ
jgi:uncharacterized protein (TIGR03437 family)